jgi:hypothetical protein
MRPDHAILKLFYEKDRASFVKFKSYPFFDLSSTWEAHAFEPPIEQRPLSEQIACWKRRPFPVAVYCVKFKDTIVDLCVQDADTADAVVIEAICIDKNIPGLTTIGVEIDFAEDPRGVVLHQLTESTVPLHQKQAFCTVADIAYSLLELLQTSPKHVVEVTPSASRAAHQASKKPWVADTTRYILLDLAEAKQYGHRTEVIGTHSKPIPHARRAHWMTLRADRFGKHKGTKIWRRAAWVGDKEWVSSEARYRVINIEKAGAYV